MPYSLGIVVPAFRPDVVRLDAYVEALDDRLSPETIRIELDDPAPGVVDALASLPATVHAVGRRRGKGAAVTAGFEALETDVLAFADADGATPADSVANVVEPVASGEVGIAVGSRRHPRADVRAHQTVLRRFLGDGFAWFARRLLDARLYDYQCGAKAIVADAWQTIRGDLHEPGFAWDIEFVALAAARGVEIAEVPVVWVDRAGSTVDPVRDPLCMLRGLAVAAHRAKVASGSHTHRLIAADGGPSLTERVAAETRDRRADGGAATDDERADDPSRGSGPS